MLLQQIAIAGEKYLRRPDGLSSIQGTLKYHLPGTIVTRFLAFSAMRRYGKSWRFMSGRARATNLPSNIRSNPPSRNVVALQRGRF
jgi:hypothetical protein